MQSYFKKSQLDKFGLAENIVVSKKEVVEKIKKGQGIIFSVK